MRASVRACVRVFVRVCVRACVNTSVRIPTASYIGPPTHIYYDIPGRPTRRPLVLTVYIIGPRCYHFLNT